MFLRYTDNLRLLSAARRSDESSQACDSKVLERGDVQCDTR